ncbi:PIN domain-containing protein [Phenylobacterium sp.]|uniref:PIN domain-containing protein n=1 Tax=Phenylobacterium sp. TaxID=1871053 RepID=UPI0037CC2533
MILSLDSNVLVDVMRGAKRYVRERMDHALASGSELVVSTIVAQELVLGAQLSARPGLQFETLSRLLADLRVEPWTWEDAVATGRLRAERDRIGRRLPSYDTLIAGQALARGWTVVTGNVRDFQEIEGLHLIDWSDPAGPIDLTGGLASLPDPTKD